MSIMVWQVLRKLPKPLLLIFLFFLLKLRSQPPE